MAYSVSQNTSFYTAASILQKAVSFIYFTIIARAIGVSGTGLYFFAIAFTTIFTVVADFGLAPVLTREAAKFPEKSQQYLTTIFWIKALFGFVAYLLVVIAVNVLQYEPMLKMLIMVSGITMFFDNLQTVFSSIFRARRNMLYESISIVLSQTITMGIGLFAVKNGWPLWSLIVAYTIASGCTLVFFVWYLRKVYGVFPKWYFSKREAKQFLIMAIPFAVAGIVGRFYSYSDSIIMSKLLDSEHLGWWSVPYKMTFAFQFIAVALSTSVYPVMSALHATDIKRVVVLFERAWKYLFMVSLPLAFGLGVLAEPVITSLYGPSYAPSVPVLQVLLVSLVFGYLSFITGATLNATNNQKKQTMLLIVTLATNIVLNVILIPLIGIQGAAISALLGNIVLAVGGFWLVKQVVPLSGERVVKFVAPILFAAAFMGLFVYATIQRTSWVVGIPVGIVVYIAMLYSVGGITQLEIVEFKDKIFKKTV